MDYRDTSAYSRYDYQEKSPAQRGGEKRAEYAIRDQQGRFMPVKDEVAFEKWKLDPEHGKPGGKVNAAIAARDIFGRFTRREEDPA